jgi:hypothetical protein
MQGFIEQQDIAIFLPGRFGREGEERGLKLLVDAEYTYMNPGIQTI